LAAPADKFGLNDLLCRSWRRWWAKNHPPPRHNPFGRQTITSDVLPVAAALAIMDATEAIGNREHAMVTVLCL
jgi:hypothetical protein